MKVQRGSNKTSLGSRIVDGLAVVAMVCGVLLGVQWSVVEVTAQAVRAYDAWEISVPGWMLALRLRRRAGAAFGLC